LLFLLTLCAHTCYLFLEVNFFFSTPYWPNGSGELVGIPLQLCLPGFS
jgi:hypothetical protein